MRRREFIAGLGSAAAWPVVARAQQPAVVGVLGIATAEGYALNIAAFMQGLKEGGFIEGQNVVIEQRWANYRYDRLPEMAAELVRQPVAVMLAPDTFAALTTKAATTTVPIVFAMGGDPVALGLVASLNRPGANVTGIANLSGELNPKQLQLLRELTPNAALFGVLADPAFPSTPSLVADLQWAAHTLGLKLVVVNASTDSDLEKAFARLSQQRVGAVLVGTSALYNRRTGQLAALAARHALPAIYPFREFALAGGLISYGSRDGYAFHQAGLYTGRILKGEKPADLPVLQPTKETSKNNCYYFAGRGCTE